MLLTSTEKRLQHIFISGLIAFLLTTAPAVGDPFVFNLIPASGNVSGLPGSTVGWGYQLTNPSATSWLVTSGLNSGSFIEGTPNSLFDFPVLAPFASVTTPFNRVAGDGLYELTIDSAAPLGLSNSGTFSISADFWTGDPFAGGVFIAGADTQSRPYDATVGVIAGAPEPVGWPLFALSAFVVAFICRRAVL